MTQYRTLASGLQFPEGPIPLENGDVLVVEIARGTLTRISPGGTVEIAAELGGGPNGAAIGPDGHVYVCNNGGFTWDVFDGALLPTGTPSDYKHGSIQRVDLATGAVEMLYTHCGDHPLKAPNDLVFDRHGGFWFTDTGKSFERHADDGGLYYAKADGSFISEQMFPANLANGVGLSPSHETLYMAETVTGRLLALPVVEPGRIEAPLGFMDGSKLLYGAPGFDLFDSLAVEESGNICVAALTRGGISVISPDGSLVEFVDLPDPGTTNIAFGGPDRKTAYITQAMTGELIAMDWSRAGLALEYEA